MATRSYREIRDAAKAGWSREAHDINVAAADYLRALSDAQIEIGRQISEARHARKLSQTQLEELSGVKQSEISRIENGLGNPTEETLVRLTTAMGARVRVELQPA